MTEPSVSVVGAGYVGITTASLLANAGLKVYLIDVDAARIKKIKAGKAPFFEAGLDNLIQAGLKQAKLIPTTDYDPAISNSAYIFSCVGTPDKPDGSSNLSYVFAAAEEAAKHMQPGAIFIQKSTVPVGTGLKIQQLFKKLKKPIKYVSNPEFLREGTAIADSLWFDRVVAGSDDSAAAKKVLGLYKLIEKNRAQIATKAKIKSLDNPGSYFTTSQNSAELVKVTANAFLALKISFANSIAKLADRTNSDINEVLDVVGADRRIGRAFLNAGRGYGGGCFPKDVSGLISSAQDYGVELQIMKAASELNESMPDYIASKAQLELGSLKNKRVTVLGLAFKPGTSDTRRSPGVKLANILYKKGAAVNVYDPKGNGEAKAELNQGIAICPSLEGAVKNSQAVFVATDWPEFINYNLSKLAKNMAGKLFVDCMNGFTAEALQSVGLKYIGVGR